MQNNLVIVESPAKAKTIEKFLGEGYKVRSSYGHIRDLKQKAFSIDIKDHFKPIYEIPEDKKKIVTELKDEARKADMVWLASDEDREGEAISWHLYEVLQLDPQKTKRIVFNEITKSAILKAIEHPRHINIDLVNAQQARRVLDRIVGFELSPVLWRKIKPALSAGRVQSVAVRLIVEREREINAFVSEASYKVVATFIDTNKAEIRATLSERFKTKEEAQAFLETCRDAQFTIDDIVTRPVKKSPAPPFTTSTLQQEAARKLGFTVAQTMMIAQRLYESGLITYMRTDSVNLSELALNTSRDTITSLMGDRYVQTRQYATKTKGAQEAHEAIRPTYMQNDSIEGTHQEKRLYELIWKRTLASQMADAELKKTTATIRIDNSDKRFIATGEAIVFDGFLRVYKESYDEDQEQDDESRLLPTLEIGQNLTRKEISATERFSQAPARYTEASLVRKLEELGIGRPSTYAPTISTIQQRGYVEKGSKEGVQRSYHMLQLIKHDITEDIQTETTGNEKSKLIPTFNFYKQVYFSKLYRVNNITLGDCTLEKVIFTSVPKDNGMYNALYRPVLGRTIMENMVWKFDMDNNEMTIFSLKNKEKLKQETTGFTLVEDGVNNLPLCSEQTDSLNLMLDLGSNYDVIIDKDVYEKLRQHHVPRKYVNFRREGLTDTIAEFSGFTMYCNGVAVPNCVLDYIPSINKNVAGNLFAGKMNFILAGENLYIKQRTNTLLNDCNGFPALGLGINIRNGSICITALEINGPAEKSGLMLGDKVIAVNNGTVSVNAMSVSNGKLEKYVQQTNSLTLEIERNGKRQTFNVTRESE